MDGFRLDAVDFLMRDPQLRANPPMAPATSTIPAKPFGLQRHIHDMAHADTTGLLARLREVADEYGGRVLLGELSSQPGAGQRIDRYTKQSGLDSAYTLDLPKQPFSARALFSALMAAGSGATTCWSFSNHDVERAASRWKPAGADPARFAALLALLFCCLPGTLCLYQGEELGLPQAELAYDDLRDPFGMAFWPEFPGRDGARTPMPWITGARNAGFTDAESPWLPVPESHQTLAVDGQEMDPASTLNVWRRCLALRRQFPDLTQGDLSEVDEDGEVLAFTRGDRLVGVFNLSNARAEYVLPPGRYTPVETPLPAGTAVAAEEGVTLTLPPLGALLVIREA